MNVLVSVKLKNSVEDIEGNNIQQHLSSSGYPGVKGVGVQKLFELVLATTDEAEALQQAEDLAKKYLINPMTEDYTILSVGDGKN